MNTTLRPEVDDKPLATFALFAYNQERFIEQAVRAALAQTYEPLEVILSDDCSHDSTFEIIERLAEDYSGSQKVIVNRNSVNFGVAGHLNKIMEIATGELIVVAAGDDVSMPERVDKIISLWIESGRCYDSLCSDMEVIDVHGNFIRQQNGTPFRGSLVNGVRGHFSGLQGASHAWTRRIWDVFGELLESTVCEDRTIPLRAALLGGTGYCAAPLVRYRIHDSNLSHYHTTAEEKVIAVSAGVHHRNAMISKQHIEDLNAAKKITTCDPDEILKAKKVARRSYRIGALKAQFLRAPKWKKPFHIFSMFVCSPAQAARCTAILLFPRRYLVQQRKNLGLG